MRENGYGHRQRRVGALVTLATVSAALAIGGASAPTASAGAWPSPTVVTPPTVSADALPTVQINGVVWAQAVVGNTVYVGGNFTMARPAGAAPGTNQTPRSNFLAYDLTTGNLLTSVVFNADAQVRTIEASPDGSRVYVGGDFTSFGGQPRNRIAAINTANNTLVANFAPNVGFHVYDIGVSNTTVYVGGNFMNVGVQVRERLAAFNLNGQLLSWAPSVPDRAVWAVRVSPDGSKVAIAGGFETLNGSSTFGRGFGVVDGVTGATLPFAATSVIRNGGPDGAITSLETDGELLYGTGYTYGRNAGTLESVFAAEWGDGTLRWVSDCHGDTYSTFPSNGAVYTASHSHYCGNINGFGQPDEWEYNRGLAFSKAVGGTVMTERLGYSNFAGQPRPDLLNFFPSINAGTFTGMTQGPWSVAGNDRYIVYGGEFTSVNGTAQQGLVRFQTRQFASNKQGPSLFNATYPIKIQSFTAGTATISWQANRDRDDATLKYTVYRRPAGTTGNGTIRHTRNITAPFWNRPVFTWTDSGTDVVPGTAYEYRVQVTDGYSNFANSVWTAFTIPTTGAASNYLNAVLQSEPDSYWRLGQASGTAAPDLVGWRDATYPNSGVTYNQAGALGGDTNTAVRLNGNTGVYIRTASYELPPQVFSLEAWFRTPSNANGGLIVGFNNSNTANSNAGSTSAHDRHVYMDTNGRIHFALNGTTAQTLTGTRNYRDDQWHHVVATIGDEGARLYVDGAVISERTDLSYARTGYYGYWRIGGGALNGFPSTNTSTQRWFDGSIDEVALYKDVLTAGEVAGHYAASGRNAPNVPPTAAFTAAIAGDGQTANFDGTGSVDPDGTIVNWAWNFGDGSPVSSGASATASHLYASAGTFNVSLTVTDDKGTTHSASSPVTLLGANALPVADFTAAAIGRDVTLDGAGSSDPDGSIVNWAWDFGDGSPAASGSASSVNHTYATAGEYDVQLTVTDNRGGKRQITRRVSTNDLPIAPPPPTATVAADSFERTVANGLGNADTGGAWTVSGTVANYSVAAGQANIRMANAGAGPTALLNGAVSANVSMSADITLDKPATGGGTYVTLIGRRIGTTGDYRANLRYQANGTVQATIVRRTGTTDAVLANVNAVPGLAPAAGQWVSARFEVLGTNPTQLRLKVWAAGTPEPATWLLSATDAAASHQSAGTLGVAPYLSGSATNAPVVASIDNLVVTDPAAGLNATPTARFATLADDLTAGFDAGVSVDDGTIQGWSWNFGDGATSTQGPAVSHTYAAPGTYAVTLTVVDNQGASHQATLDVSVNAP